MTRPWIRALFAATMVVVVIGIDLLFLRHHLALRLLVNVGIVLAFIALYLAFLRNR